MKALNFFKSKEAQKAYFLFFFFFCVIASFWALKPLRTSGVVKTIGIEFYPLVKQGTLLVIPLFVILYSYLSQRFSRPKLARFWTAFFILCSWLLWLLYQMASGGWLKVVFFYFVDTYITVMVTVFWAYTNDTFNSHNAKKYYGIVGAGGILGGIVGSGISGWLSTLLGENIILVPTLFLGAIFGIIFFLEKISSESSEIQRSPIKSKKDKSKIWSEGLKLVFSSKYLLAIVTIVGVYEVFSTIVDYQFTFATDKAFTVRDEMGSYIGKVFFYAQIASLFVQLFITPFVHQRLGVVTGLLVLPIIMGLGSGFYLVASSLFLITATIGSEAAFSYSLNQSSKEIMYVPLSRDEKYKAKAFIDMFVFRFGKTIGGLVTFIHSYLIVKVWQIDISIKYLSFISLVLFVLWIASILRVRSEITSKMMT